MKYSQACLLKKKVDGLIDKLTQNLMGVNLTDTARMRLVVAHVSLLKGWDYLHWLISDVGQHVGARGAGQCNGLDWDADDIDPDNDDRRLWVPMMAQTLKMGASEGSRPFPAAAPAVMPPTHLTPPQQMSVYMVQPN